MFARIVPEVVPRFVEAMYGKLFVRILLVLTLVSASWERTDRENEIERYLLTGELKPIHYNVHLVTHLDKIRAGNGSEAAFDGRVQIFMRSTERNVSRVVLNSGLGTEVHDAVLHREGHQPVTLNSFHFNASTQKLTFNLPTSVEMNELLRLDLNYTSRYTSVYVGLFGFLYGDYETDSKKRWILFTELQPAYARLVFPCFDEPKYKTTYNVSVAVPSSLVSEGYHALSNAPEYRRERIGEDVVFHFEQTKKPMSTYLFSVVVSDLASTKPRHINASYPDVERGELRTWGSSKDIGAQNGEILQTMSSALMKIYSKDFNFGYSFSKLDGVLNDVYVGAMENWGLVLYQHTIILSPNEFSARLIAHELAHQWFGNTVTLHWWSDVWINEGFAVYHEYFGPDKINEEGIDGKSWELQSRFVNDNVQYRGMFSDVPEHQNHPLTVEVYDPEEYFDYFDKCEYGKGGAVVYMWRHITGEETFHRVVHDFLDKFRYGVATPEGLLEMFDAHSNETVSDLMGMKPSRIFRDWHLKAGVPIVSVRKCTQNPTVYVLSQDVFRLSKATEPGNATWFIPISYSTSDRYNFGNTKAEFWLKPGETLNLTLPKAVKWIVCNNQQTGYYRVNYNIENWKALFDVIKNTAEDIDEINRSQIIDDSAEIAKSTAFDYLPYGMVLDMLLYLKKETSHTPWISALNKLQFLKDMMSKDEADYKHFRSYVLDLLSNSVEDAWRKQKSCDSRKTHAFEKRVVSLACEMGHPSCADEADSIIHRSLESEGSVCHDLLEIGYCSYVRINDGDDSFWELLWDRYVHSKNPMHKKLLMNGMGCTKKEILLRRLFERATDFERDITRAERKDLLFAVLRGNAENAKMLLNFVTDSIEKVLSATRKNLFDWDFLIDAAHSLGTDEELTQVRGIAEKLRDAGHGKRREVKKLEKAISIVKTNGEWLEIRRKSVSDWLNSKY